MGLNPLTIVMVDITAGEEAEVDTVGIIMINMICVK